MNLDPKYLETIARALDNSIKPEDEERKPAEDLLAQAKKMPGYVSALLQISRGKNFPKATSFSSNVDALAAI